MQCLGAKEAVSEQEASQRGRLERQKGMGSEGAAQEGRAAVTDGHVAQVSQEWRAND